MSDLEFKVDGVNINLVRAASLIPSGSVGIYSASFDMDDSWNGWNCLACFKSEGKTVDAVIENGACVIPWEALQPGAYLDVGVYGTRGNDRRPTIWAQQSIYVARGVEPGEDTKEPSPTVYEALSQNIAANRSAIEKRKEEMDAELAEIKMALIPTADETVLEGLTETGLITPVGAENGVFVSENNAIYVM